MDAKRSGVRIAGAWWLAAALVAVSACGSESSDDGEGSGGSGGDAGTGGDTAAGGSTGGESAGGSGTGGAGGAQVPACFENPTTHLELINACTTAEAIDKDDTYLPLLNADGSLPPLP